MCPPSNESVDPSALRSFPCKKGCRDRTFRSSQGLTQHYNSVHPVLSSDAEGNEQARVTFEIHPRLTGQIVDSRGRPLPEHTRPPGTNTEEENIWAPFSNRLEFDWAHYHYVELQSSKSVINKGLDLWAAAKVEATKSSSCDPLPWASADELYKTLDSIQGGVAPFETYQFKYNGPLPPPGQDAPSWMTDTFELCVRDVRHVLHSQISNPDFDGKWNTAPYREFDSKKERVWSNLMSGDWVWREADKIYEADKSTEGAMLVPVVTGLDKTTVSVATGHQEYHPFYLSAGNLTNPARRGHGAGVIPVAFLPIPKVSKRQKKRKDYQRFARQLYHSCIALIFAPLREVMSKPEIVRCVDGHFRRAIYSIGPVIADYPEQVWLSGIVQGWCAKCFNRPENLDGPDGVRRTHEKIDFLLKHLSASDVWEQFGVRDDVVPFTHGYPRADIHELMAPDLLHQVIKGTFKDHLVTWVNEYITAVHPEAKALEIIQDIDRRIAAVPVYPGLRRFSDGRNFNQWTGDDSKALMKVYIAAIVGYVPDRMVECLSSFMDICYIFRRNKITTSALTRAEQELKRFHALREVFVEHGTRAHCSLPRQHALTHFITAIPEFGSPNGLCSSITESRHITAVKEPWRRSSRFNALPQMLQIIVRLDQLAELRTRLSRAGQLEGSTAWYMACSMSEGAAVPSENDGSNEVEDAVGDIDGELIDDEGPSPGLRVASSIRLSNTSERAHRYPRRLDELVITIQEPQFPSAMLEYLYNIRHPNRVLPSPIEDHIQFQGRIYVYHSAVARFFSPSDSCGAGGMHRQTIRCNRFWKGYQRFDTVLVDQDDEPSLNGMLVAQLRLLFSFFDPYTNQDLQCALVNWFPTVGDEPDPVTGMWVVEREEIEGECPVQVIPLASIVRGVHLLPVYGKGRLPETLSYVTALEDFERYFVNSYIDHHAHELLFR
ncbi:hypothetical protein DFP72DRAFT_1036008 [Ephemerocybe angulata]|uniref:C2H2-type domain-containing protein n=1 Tax=Ephemerocybe angulata TaxID=980116 RepID=A0A8H6LX87_9AGAR|nr:hypothetical protein DFP72DRAFT_1036008 [Tulosesus angulatus]